MREDILEALGCADAAHTSARSASTTAWSRPAVEALEGSGIPVASVSTGFPAGLTPLDLKRHGDPMRRSATAPREIDIVITARSMC